MFPGVAKQANHMVIVEGIKRLPSVAAGAHQARRTQEPQLMGHGGFGNTDKRGEVTHTPFPMGQRVEDAHPGGISKYLENLGDGLQGHTAQQPGANLFKGGQIHDLVIYEHVLICQPASIP